MKICRPVIYLIFLLAYTSINGQSIFLSGSGNGYQNAELRIYSQTDPVTKRLKPLKNVTCDVKGSFSCELPAISSEIIFIKTGIYNLHLYVTGNSRYDLLLPDYVAKPGKEDQNPFFIETEYIPEVINNKKDVNNLIRDFDSEYNPVFNLVADHIFKNYKRDEIPQEIAKLDKFPEVKDLAFYNDYIRCRIMMLKLVVSSANRDLAEATEFLNNGFNPANQAFTDLAEQMFSGYFNIISTGPKKDAFRRAIGTGYYSDLQLVILSDGKIKNKELADYVALLNLNADYYDKNLPGENVRMIISAMKSQGETGFIKNIASVLLERINSSLPGNYLPDFTLSDIDGKLKSLKDFRGKYLLLGFIRSDNPLSQTEIGIINMWQKKYAKDVQVVTVLADKNFKSAATFLKNRGFNWTFLDGSIKENIEYTYDLKMYPSFLILDREGKIISDPCSYPSENLESKIYKILLSDPAGSGTENR